jgi:hypothetical protein
VGEGLRDMLLVGIRGFRHGRYSTDNARTDGMQKIEETYVIRARSSNTKDKRVHALDGIYISGDFHFWCMNMVVESLQLSAEWN